MMQSDLVELHAIVSGDIQGVGFRAFVCSIALKLVIKGTVRNLPNGDVEIYAQGAQKELQQFLKQIRITPSHIRVDSVTTEYYPLRNDYNSFMIVR